MKDNDKNNNTQYPPDPEGIAARTDVANDMLSQTPTNNLMDTEEGNNDGNNLKPPGGPADFNYDNVMDNDRDDNLPGTPTTLTPTGDGEREPDNSDTKKENS